MVDLSQQPEIVKMPGTFASVPRISQCSDSKKGVKEGFPQGFPQGGKFPHRFPYR